MDERDEPGLFSWPLDGRRTWFVLHTRSRQEKALAQDLGLRGVPHFLPVARQMRLYGKRKFALDVPLFAGYIFVRGTQDEVYAADRTKRVAEIIRVADQQGINWELRNIFLALENRVPLDPYPMLKAGVRVEVRSGPLRGLQGWVERRDRPDRLVLQVQMLGSAVSLEVDAALLDVV